MRYTVSITESTFSEISSHMSAETERAGYLLGKISVTGEETRILIREFIRVAESEILITSPTSISISSRSFMRAMKRADHTRQAFFFIHSHPNGLAAFSGQDDREEAQLMKTAYTRIDVTGPHGTMVWAGENGLIARCWIQDGSKVEVNRIRVVGEALRFFDLESQEKIDSLFERQVGAFGGGIQSLLGRLHVGVVGCGGTGSAVAEQLVRLGIGKLSLFDPDRLEASNISRVYGSTVADIGKPKATIIRDALLRIGSAALIDAVDTTITHESTARRLRDCDLIFGCTDDQWGRAILTRFAIYYYVPVVDMGVRIDSSAGTINSIQGRVTILFPGAACLFCRGRITGDRIAEQAIRESNPERAAELRQEGYLPELPTAEPAVISFNSSIAAWAIIELLHKFVGFLGEDRRTTEILFLFDQSRIRTNSVLPRSECFCSEARYHGRGDVNPFLDLTWSTE